MTVKIKVCMGSACFARGNLENITIIEQYIKDHHLDAEIELFGARCEEKCECGPNIYIDDVCFQGVTPERILKVLEELKA